MTNDFIKFTAILICFVIAATGRDWLSKRDYVLLTAAMAATVIADFFLVVIYDYVIGVAFFCAVQVLYIMRFGGISRLRILPLTLVFPFAFITFHGDALVAIALLYAQLFLFSYVSMLQTIRKKTLPTTSNILIFIGMTAFVLCDICVAIWNLGRWDVITNTDVISFAHASIWLFYTPAQICLALSGRKFASPTLRTNNSI